MRGADADNEAKRGVSAPQDAAGLSMVANMTHVRPKSFLRWAGSKRSLIPKLAAFWSQDYARYIEPFAGSSSLFFALQPRQAILSDINADLIATYEAVRQWPEKLYSAVISTPKDTATYYHVRSQNPRSPFRRAVRFIYLNRNCFNGIYRTNALGRFNVPIARRPGRFLSRAQFRASATALEQVRLYAWDFGKTLRFAKRGDFVYLDPPYAVSSRRIFREYGARPFSNRDLERLARHLCKLNNRGADFLVSYADCPESRRLARAWSSMRVRVKRHVAGFADARRHAYELLISNVHPMP
jgi:DNA adenine methylase